MAICTYAERKSARQHFLGNFSLAYTHTQARNLRLPSIFSFPYTEGGAAAAYSAPVS